MRRDVKRLARSEREVFRTETIYDIYMKGDIFKFSPNENIENQDMKLVRCVDKD